MTTILALGDIHSPYHDPRAVELACRLLEAIQPEVVIHLADGVDFYQLSTFDRDPDRLLQLQDDLDKAYSVHKDLALSAPEADWLYLDNGNHERRLWRYLTRHPEIAGLEVLSLASLLRFGELGWTLVPEYEALAKRLVFTHGEAYSKHAGWGAKKELEKRYYQQSVIMGHTHKIGQITARGPRLMVAGWEIGCLCTLEPDYRTNANWQQGLAVVTLSEQPSTHAFSVEQVTFTGTGRARRAFFRGNEYVVK